MFAPPPLWMPPRRRLVCPPRPRFDTLNMAAPGKVQRNTSGRINRFRDGPNAGKMVRNRDTGTTCCCGPQAQWTQFRRCTNGSLAPLWGMPNDPAQVFPWTMWYKGDKKCYYRDGTEPTSTSPVGAIIYPVVSPSFVGDYLPLPTTEDCFSGFCSPTPCSNCSGRTPAWYVAEVAGVIYETDCIVCNVDPGQGIKSFAFDANGTYLLVYSEGGTCAWGLTDIGEGPGSALFNTVDCSDPQDMNSGGRVFIGCDVTATEMRAYIGIGGGAGLDHSIFDGSTAIHDCMSPFTISNSQFPQCDPVTGWASGGTITLTPGPAFN